MSKIDEPIPINISKIYSGSMHSKPQEIRDTNHQNEGCRSINKTNRLLLGLVLGNLVFHLYKKVVPESFPEKEPLSWIGGVIQIARNNTIEAIAKL